MHDKMKRLGLTLSALTLLSLIGFSSTSTDIHASTKSESVITFAKKGKDVPQTPYSEKLFVPTADAAVFKKNLLKGNTYSIKIVKKELIEKDGNKYVQFTYDTIVNKNYTEEPAIVPNIVWGLNFNVIQDNDPNKINKLNECFTPEKYLDNDFAEIKPGGVVRSAVAYKLSDTKTPIKLIAGDLVGRHFGEREYKIK